MTETTAFSIAGPKGNTFLLMKRSEKGPNSFSQEMKGLESGRLYSMRMITADHGNITAQNSVNQQDVVSIQLDGVELEAQAGKNTQETYKSMRYIGQFTQDQHAWLNFHWYIFRAKGTSARLQVSDWASADAPGGPHWPGTDGQLRGGSAVPRVTLAPSKGTHTLIAVNVKRDLTLAKWVFDTPAQLKVLFEDRIMASEERIVSDLFKPLEVHIYQWKAPHSHTDNH